MRVSARHEGDVDGQLVPFSESGKTAVTLVLDDSAQLIAVQHAAWMFANLAVRLGGYVEKVSIFCPDGVPIHRNVLPFSSGESDFGLALKAAASSLGIVPVVANEMLGIQFFIGPGVAPANGWRVYGNGWIGGITKSSINAESPSVLPFGPYVAACFAASEIFKEMRLRHENYRSSEGFFDAWTLKSSRAACSSEPLSLPELELECTLAGVGAVGTAFLHTMFACPMLKLSAAIADNDSKGLDITNLNRYVLFGTSSVGKLKPDAVCEMFEHSHLRLTPCNGGAETLPKIGDRVLSAVDKNKSREGIQYQYPSRIISASTSGLRAEVLRCGPPGKGACLRCYNPPEVLPTDDEKIAKLREAGHDELARYCEEVGISPDEGKAWLNSPKERCGEAGESLLGVQFAVPTAQGVFSVGFTSVFAGVLLASEFLKDCMGVGVPLNDSVNNFSFQFFDVLSAANDTSLLAVDPNCPLCHARTLSTWQRRFGNLKPIR
jgi:molybdopterin/thiamine biosynthesis adenylyltransferase